MIIFEKIALFFNPPLAGLDCLLDTRFIHLYSRMRIDRTTLSRLVPLYEVCSLRDCVLYWKYYIIGIQVRYFSADDI